MPQRNRLPYPNPRGETQTPAEGPKPVSPKIPSLKVAADLAILRAARAYWKARIDLYSTDPGARRNAKEALYRALSAREDLDNPPSTTP